MHRLFSYLASIWQVAIESSGDVEPEIDIYPVKKGRYEQYSSELCVFSNKNKSVDSLGTETVQGL